MDRHFAQWSNRNLSLLGKIQIYKTFGLSQYLYHLSLFEPTQGSWKLIIDKINKFLWNKKYYGNTAPHRIKKEVLYSPISMGGFGMLDLRQVITALRLRRHLILLENNTHPLHDLILALTYDNDYISDQVFMDIDEIINFNLTTLQKKKLSDYEAPEWQLEADLLLQTSLLNTKITNITRPRKLGGREITTLSRRGYVTLHDIISRGSHVNALIKIARKELIRIIPIIKRNFAFLQTHQIALPVAKLRNKAGQWLTVNHLTSKVIRETLFEKLILIQPKITIMDDHTKAAYYNNLSKLINMPNKTKMLRLLQGDVYTAERLKRFGMSNSDICRRCFGKETIYHLLLECPYSIEIYNKLGLTDRSINEILGIGLNRYALEIRSEILVSLLFRLQTMPTDVLLKTTLEKFANGIANKHCITKLAKRMLQLL